MMMLRSRRSRSGHNEAMRAADYAFFDVPFCGLRDRAVRHTAQSASREQPARVPRGGRSRLSVPGDRCSCHPRRSVAGVSRRRSRPGDQPDRRNCRPELRAGLRSPDSRNRPDTATVRAARRSSPRRGSTSTPSRKAAVALLVSTIAEFDAYDRVCVSSFGIRRIHELRRRLGWRVHRRRVRWELPPIGSCRGLRVC